MVPVPSQSPSLREVLLAKTYVEMVDTLVADFDVVELPTRLADRCVDLLHCRAHAGGARWGAASDGFVERSDEPEGGGPS
jgi:hypothetical protein